MPLSGMLHAPHLAVLIQVSDGPEAFATAEAVRDAPDVVVVHEVLLLPLLFLGSVPLQVVLPPVGAVIPLWILALSHVLQCLLVRSWHHPNSPLFLSVRFLFAAGGSAGGCAISAIAATEGH